MILQRFFSTALIGLAFFFVPITSWGQFPSGFPQMVLTTADASSPAISAAGTSSIKRLPSTIRVIVPIQAKGKTIEDALKSLETERKTALDKIQKIGFTEENIRVEGFSFDQSQENKRRQMERMIAQRMGQAGAKKTTSTESVAIRCMLYAEWPMTGNTVEEIFKESHTLKQKILAANLIPKPEGLSPEEEELAEEMEAMNYSGEEESSNEPRFIFVAKVSDEEGQKAYAEAFEQAQKQGALLAKAAGFKLGPLKQIAGSVTKNQETMEPYSRYNHDPYLAQMIHAQQFGNDETSQFEGIAASPDSITFTFIIHVSFGMDR